MTGMDCPKCKAQVYYRHITGRVSAQEYWCVMCGWNKIVSIQDGKGTWQKPGSEIMTEADAILEARVHAEQERWAHMRAIASAGGKARHAKHGLLIRKKPVKPLAWKLEL